MTEPETYRVLMDERWTLDDLYGFPRVYSQVYDFVYCFDSEQQPRSDRRIDRALDEYPWQGGYSYVNLYFVLHHQVPIVDRPQIASIRYSSPGWMDIVLQIDVALEIAKSVTVLLGSGVIGVEAIKRIDKARLDITRNRREQKTAELEYTLAEVRVLTAMAEELAAAIGFDNLKSLEQRTKDPELTLKLLLAHTRRLKDLAEYVQSGKVKLPTSRPDNH